MACLIRYLFLWVRVQRFDSAKAVTGCRYRAVLGWNWMDGVNGMGLNLNPKQPRYQDSITAA